MVGGERAQMQAGHCLGYLLRWKGQSASNPWWPHYFWQGVARMETASGLEAESAVGSMCLHDMSEEPEVVDGDEARGTRTAAHTLWTRPLPFDVCPLAPCPLLAPCSLS